MATNTYVALSTQTLASAVSSVTFSSIPQGYTDLVLIVNASSTSTNNHHIRVGNGSIDTGSNYSTTILYGDGSSVGSTRVSGQVGYIYAGQGSTSQFTDVFNFQNYSNTTTNKTVINRTSVVTAGGWVGTNVGLWRSTSAINTIEYYATAGNINAGSTFTIYGIAADTGAYSAKATGGTITTDQFNVIHTFTSSGTFTPTQGLVVDYLVIAGGGAGGNGNGGSAGGGAGGYLTSVGSSGGGGAQGSPLSLSSGTAYTITVGAGGTGGVGSSGTSTNGVNSSIESLVVATGGGRGGSYGSTQAGASGGSGGGSIGVGGLVAGGTGTTGQGYAGGSGNTNEATYRSAGGGGGAGAVGGNGPTSNGAGAGGAGLASTITGTSVTRAGGGGGINGGTSAGGTGGGGAGGATGTAGTDNTGSGGGGGTWGGSGGGNGGSGVVIIRYLK